MHGRVSYLECALVYNFARIVMVLWGFQYTIVYVRTYARVIAYGYVLLS